MTAQVKVGVCRTCGSPSRRISEILDRLRSHEGLTLEVEAYDCMTFCHQLSLLVRGHLIPVSGTVEETVRLVLESRQRLSGGG